MHSFTLLYVLYSAKLSSQASIYFIWLVDSSSRTIAFIAAAAAVLAVFPFFHVIVHVFSAKPLSNPTFIAYLCFSFLLAILWFKPTQDGEQRVLPFAVVTAFDLLALFIFLFQRQIGHWHDILTSDIEQGHLRGENRNDASVALIGQDNEQVHPGDPDEMHRLQIMHELGYDVNAINRSGRAVGDSTVFDSRSKQPGIQVSGDGGCGTKLDRRSGGSADPEVPIQRSRSVGWNAGVVPPTCASQEMEEADLGLRPQQRRSGLLIDLNGGAGFKTPHSPQTPTTIISSNTYSTIIPTNTHPANRSTLDNTRWRLQI
ncbi:hypothetical protein BGZ60DRAFT_404944 [Tricladium varicosporioides]|nr:hypothetical protein BGZ60DRAFT_404944 [Hymenoscyphus varicosporioides]